MVGRILLASFSLVILSGCASDSSPSNLPPPSFPEHRAAAQPLPPPTHVTPDSRTSAKPYVYHPPGRTQVLPGVPADWVPPIPARPWKWIVIHHSATPTGGAAAFDRIHKAKGWDGLGYDMVVGNGTDTGDGQVEIGYRWVQQIHGAHAKTPDNRYNELGIGICLVGNFDISHPSPRQMQSLAKLVGFLMKQYHISPDRVIGHGETKATDCPGRNTSLVRIRQMALNAMADVGSFIPANEPTAKADLLESNSQAMR